MLKRVIVVDDDKEIQEIVTFVLNRNGFEVAVASNGQQLQRLLATQVPDLIILDVMMLGKIATRSLARYVAISVLSRYR